MKADPDAFGTQLLAQFQTGEPAAEIIEREDGYIDLGSDAGMYFRVYADWSEPERKVIDQVTGRVLDVGCGAGRHALHLQQQGIDVTAIDNSPGAVRVCELRGVKKVLVRAIGEVDGFDDNSFDTIIMMGNNLGVLESRENAGAILSMFSRITSPNARIIAGTRDPYRTDDIDHLQYHKSNQTRGRMAGQIRMRVRYRKMVGEWFDYLFVSPAELQEILVDTDWQIAELIDDGGANYFAILNKR